MATTSPSYNIAILVVVSMRSGSRGALGQRRRGLGTGRPMRVALRCFSPLDGEVIARTLERHGHTICHATPEDGTAYHRPDVDAFLVAVHGTVQDPPPCPSRLPAGARVIALEAGRGTGRLIADRPHVPLSSRASVESLLQVLARIGGNATPRLCRSHQACHAKARLTQREYQCLHALARGESTADIAAVLGVRSETVRGYVHNVLWKLGVSDRLEAACRLRKERDGMLEHTRKAG